VTPAQRSHRRPWDRLRKGIETTSHCKVVARLGPGIRPGLPSLQFEAGAATEGRNGVKLTASFGPWPPLCASRTCRREPRLSPGEAPARPTTYGRSASETQAVRDEGRARDPCLRRDDRGPAHPGGARRARVDGQCANRRSRERCAMTPGPRRRRPGPGSAQLQRSSKLSRAENR
jgi:hypothetical protein